MTLLLFAGMPVLAKSETADPSLISDLIASGDLQGHLNSAWELVLYYDGQITDRIGVGAGLDKEIRLVRRASRLQRDGAPISIALTANGQKLRELDPTILLHHALELSPDKSNTEKLADWNELRLSSKSAGYCHSEYQFCLSDCRALPVVERITCREGCGQDYDYCIQNGGGESDGDADNDGILPPDDNCPITANPGQEDCDADGQGDACDASVSDYYRLNDLGVCAIVGSYGPAGTITIHNVADFSSNCRSSSCRSSFLSGFRVCDPGETGPECCDRHFGPLLCQYFHPVNTCNSTCY